MSINETGHDSIFQPPCPVYVLLSNCFQHTVYIVHSFRQPGRRPRQSVGADCPCQKGETDEALPLSNEQHQHPEQKESSCDDTQNHPGKQTEEPGKSYQQSQGKDYGEQQHFYEKSQHNGNLLIAHLFQFDYTALMCESQV